MVDPRENKKVLTLMHDILRREGDVACTCHPQMGGHFPRCALRKQRERALWLARKGIERRGEDG